MTCLIRWLILSLLAAACGQEAPTSTEVTGPTSDSTAPVWPVGAVLAVSEAHADRLTVVWPSAIDDTAVTSYRIYEGALFRQSLGAGYTSAQINGLKSASNTVVEVRAEDAAGNLSAPLIAVAQTTDESAPAWPTAASLNIGALTETSALLSWTAAHDNVAVSSYRVLRGDSLLMDVGAVSAEVTELTAWTEYTLQVRAVDAAGNVSSSGPQATFQTPDETAPTFDEGAAIKSSNVTPNGLTLTWPQATDNVTVAGYQVIRDMVVVATTSGTIRMATVDGLSPGTEYTFSVRASDPAGNHSSPGPSTTVNTADTQGPSWSSGAQLAVSALTANSLLLAWPPASDDVAVALYEVRQDGIAVASVSGTEAPIEGLSPWSPYQFSVRARDAVGNISQDTLSAGVQTLDGSPPGWAEGASLLVSELTSTSLTLSWPQATDDVSVAGYEVYQDEVPIAALDALTITLDVSGLSPWTDYAFRVAAVDPAGNPSTVDLKVVQKTADESTPTWPAGALVASNLTPYSLTLTWTPAADDVGVTQYQVTLNGEELAFIEGDTTNVEVIDLLPWTDYSFTVNAADAAGNWSTAGPSTALKTPDEVDPTWPTEAIRVSDLQSTSLTLSWPAATDDVGIASYVITADAAVVQTVAGDQTSALVSNLGPTLTYLIGLQAVDPAGNSSPELTTTVTTPDGGPPTWEDAKLTATAGMTDVYLTWTPATDDVAVTGYRVFRDGEQITEQAGTELLVQGLGPSTEYTFKVEARDAAGNWSADGPSATVTTAKAYDPGFRRLTEEQLHRALADVAATIWMEGCHNKFGDACECQAASAAECGYGFGQYSVAADNYTLITTAFYGEWMDYAETFPLDARVAAPNDVYGGHRRLDQLVFDEHATSWTRAAMTLAESWFKKQDYQGWERGARLILDPCKVANDTGITNFATLEEVYQNCAADFITRLGRRAFRQPLTDEEHALFMSIYLEVSEKYADEGLDVWYTATRGLRNVMATVLLSPKFLYQVELGDANGDLTAWELASRLSFHFWNTGPDDLLLAAAEDGSLLTEAGYQAQVERLAGDARAKRAVEEFYGEFFRVEDILDVDQQDGPFYQKYFYHSGPNEEAGAHPYPAGAGKNSWHYLKAAQAELINLGTWFTRTQPGTYEDMFRSNLHFLECQASWVEGQCYGAGAWGLFSYGVMGTCSDMADCVDKQFIDTGNGWDGVSEPVTLPELERAGLITRISLLGADTVTARPIRRGLKIRDMLLCEPIPPPENCDVVKPPNLTGMCESAGTSTGKSCSHDMHCGSDETCVNWDKEVTMTVREKVEEITETPGTSCAACHATFINGFGHALSHFSSVGQYWDKEHMYTSELNPQTGDFSYYTHTPDQWKPIDASATTVFQGELVSLDGAHELSDFLANTGQLEWCWAREYFRFAMGRIEWDVDADAIDELAQTLRDGTTLADAFENIVYSPQFKTLYKPPKAQGNPP